MIYIGIDVAKKNHYAAALSSEGKVLVEPFCFTNDHEGFHLLLSKIDCFDLNTTFIGLESTAHYGENLINFLFLAGFKVCIINPIQTASLRKGNIRKTKTDKVDTFIIAKALMLNDFRCVTGKDIEILKLKNLCRFRQKLIKARTKVKIQLTTYVDQLFPELQYFFKSGLHINTCYILLKEHSAPDEIAAMQLTHLTCLLKKASKGHFKREAAIQLRELAKISVGTGNKTLSIQISLSISQIELYDEQLSKIDKIIATTMLSADSVIMTIPGIGPINGAMILGEIGNILRFSHSSKLLAFAGLDPSVCQSGNFTAKHTKMSKRGSKTLRYALVNAAFNIVKNNKTFSDYYTLKISQGRSHYNALGHVAGKLVRIIYKMLTCNVEFNLN